MMSTVGMDDGDGRAGSKQTDEIKRVARRVER